MLSEIAKAAIDGLRKKLDAGALEALRSGMDWAEGPMEDPDPYRWLKPFDLFQPQRMEIQVKCGPVEPGTFDPPKGWRVIRHADWIAAGRPGDIVTVEDIANPRCGCSSEVARRVIVDHGTCNMAGCPYGGDV